jgi:hypothetical protein
MTIKLKIEKRGNEIIPLEMHFFVDSLLLVTQKSLIAIGPVVSGEKIFM